jgi:transketolase
LNWPSPPFVIPDDILADWRAIGARGKQVREAWAKRKDGAAPDLRRAFDDAVGEVVPAALGPALVGLKKQLSAEKPAIATRKASEMALEIINVVVPETIGGSADLTPSNNTKTKGMRDIAPGDFSGRYMRYGIREHGMCAAMSGMALHGGVIPYGGTFFVFSDYCRPSIRLAALMGIRVVYVMTHDSIGVGEDGPTHQPVEQLAAMRAMPNILVMRPGDAVETAECWQIALAHTKGPSLLALTRQNLATARLTHTDENLSAKGAYEIAGAPGAKVTFLATGSEVEIAMKACEMLKAEGTPSRVVSMPCWSLFEEQTAAYRDSVLGPGTVKVAIEAAAQLGWDRYIGPNGAFVGMHSFGASGPVKDVYKHFGITPEAAVEAAKRLLT